MKSLVHFVGIRRSGNHAVINWLGKNIFPDAEAGTVIHHNNIYSPKSESSPIAMPEDVRIDNPAENIVEILSYEDVRLDLFPKLPTVVGQDEILEGASVQNLLIIRDPFNTFASRLQRIRNLQKEGETGPLRRLPWIEVIDMWKVYAKEFIAQSRSHDGSFTPINYNLWTRDREYRDRLLEYNFGAVNQDRGIGDVPANGKGSSFEGLRFHGRAHEMNTQDRWRSFVNDMQYRALFQDNELFQLSGEIFGYIPGTEQLNGSRIGEGNSGRGHLK